MFKDINFDTIDGPELKKLVGTLLNTIEQLNERVDALTAENQRLRDEINRLKGGNAKPRIAPQKTSQDHSSEQQRRTPQAWNKKPKKHLLTVTRTEVVPVPVSDLPPDAQFKGWEDYLVQELRLVPDVTRYRRAKYYSASTGKTYLAPLPSECVGHFGPALRSLALYFGYVGNMSHAGIHRLFSDVGIHISAGQVNNLLVNGQDGLHSNGHDVTLAGLASSAWQHTDDTATRVNGKNQHCHVLCNPLYTAYQTSLTKDRLAVISTLLAGSPFTYVCDSAALAYLQINGLGKAMRRQIAALFPDNGQALSEAEFTQRLASMPTLGPRQYKIVREAMALSGYWAQDEVPVVSMLLCDDAPQFNFVTHDQGLCWVHDARNYSKLAPVIEHHKQILAQFMDRYWNYYRELNSFRLTPEAEEAQHLNALFDDIFSTKTDYEALNARIEKTRRNKGMLLQVLDHPEILLHNNPAELAVRRRVRKRDVSFGPRSNEGLKAWDTLMTLAETARKQGISFLQYLIDYHSRSPDAASLAELIRQAATQLNLSASWETT